MIVYQGNIRYDQNLSDTDHLHRTLDSAYLRLKPDELSDDTRLLHSID